jgi:acyl carrier protein
MAGEVEAQIRQIVADHLGVSASELAPEVSLTDDLAADSLDLFELTVVLEEALGVQIPESAIEHVRTYGEVVAVTTAALKRRGRVAAPARNAGEARMRAAGARRRVA